MREHPDVPLIRFLTFGNGEVVVCNSPDSFKEVLQTKCYSFRKSDFFRRLTKEIVGHGLVTSRLPSPLFTSPGLSTTMKLRVCRVSKIVSTISAAL